MATSSPSPAAAKPTANWRRRGIRTVLLFLVLPYVAIIVIMVCLQRQLIFVPTKTDRLYAQDVGDTVDDVEHHAADDLTLHGWRFRAAATEENESGRYLVLYFPGNGGCREHRVADCQDFTTLGCDVVLFDYRGYGDNAGSPSEERLAADARRQWLFATHDLGYPPERIVLFGESLGGAVATRLAAEFSDAGDPPAALILNSTFASMPRTVAWHYPLFPFQYFVWDRFPSIDRIPRVTCAILQFHCTADDVVPIDHGRALLNAAPPASKDGLAPTFVTIEGGGHNFITVGQMRNEIGALLSALDQR